jgi:polyphosphate kinase
MRSDGSYERAPTDDGPVRDVQETLMAATEAALDRGYGPGMAVDPDLIEEELLVEDVGESEPDADSVEPDGTTPDDDGGRPHSDGGDASIFDAYAEHWYRPDSDAYDWAVRTTDGERRYFKTRDGARRRLRAEYDGSEDRNEE